MKINPVVRGATEVQAAIAQFKGALAGEGGADAVRGAETAVLRQIAQEARLVSQVDAHGPAAKRDLVALNAANGILTQAERELVSLSAAERRKRIDEFVEPAAQWPHVPFSVDARPTAAFLQELADATGRPQAALLNDFPMVARPGGSAEAAYAAWEHMLGALPGDAAHSRLNTLGFDVDNKRGELKVAMLEKAPPRPLAEIMASLKDANPRAWLREGLQTLEHPGEMKLFVEEYLRLAPELVPAPSADKAREMAMAGLRYGLSQTLPGTQAAWSAVFDAVQPEPPL